MLAVELQVPSTRGADSLPGTVRLLRRGAWAAAVACLVAALGGRTHGGWTIAVLALAVVLTTATELWTSAAQWFFQTDIPPAAQRGAYVGMGRMIGSAGRMVAPAGRPCSRSRPADGVWWIIAAIFVGCAFAAGPTVEWVARAPRVGGHPTPLRVSGDVVPETAG